MAIARIDVVLWEAVAKFATVLKANIGRVANAVQAVDPHMRYRINQSSAGTYTLPIAGGGSSYAFDMVVDWGDGQTSIVASYDDANRTHTYAASGVYDIKLTGRCEYFVVDGFSDPDRPKYTHLLDFVGDNGLKTLGFAWCSNLVSVCPLGQKASLNNIHPAGYGIFNGCGFATIPYDLFYGCPTITNFEGAFQFNFALTGVPAGLFDQSVNATSFKQLFLNCNNPAFTSIPADLFKYNTEVTTFKFCFANTKITSLPAHIFDTNTKATDFSDLFSSSDENNNSFSMVPSELFKYQGDYVLYNNAFRRCKALHSVPADMFRPGSNWCNFNGLFSYSGITSIPVGFLNGATYCSIADMFAFSTLPSIPSGLFSDISIGGESIAGAFRNTPITSIPTGLFPPSTVVTDASLLFYGCGSLATVPSDLFSNMPNLYSAAQAFYGCGSLTSIPAGLFSSNGNLQSIWGLFYDCANITAIPETLLQNSPSINTAYFLFSGCTGVTGAIPVNLFQNQLSLNNFYGVFYNCSNMTGNGNDFIAAVTAVGRPVPSNTSGCFYNCTTLSDYASIPAGWK